MIDQIVILADETADWKIAGLSQTDRLTLELNEYFQTAHGRS